MPPHPPALGEFCTTRLATAAASHAKSRSKDDEPRDIRRAERRGGHSLDSWMGFVRSEGRAVWMFRWTYVTCNPVVSKKASEEVSRADQLRGRSICILLRNMVSTSTLALGVAITAATLLLLRVIRREKGRLVRGRAQHGGRAGGLRHNARPTAQVYEGHGREGILRGAARIVMPTATCTRESSRLISRTGAAGSSLQITRCMRASSRRIKSDGRGTFLYADGKMESCFYQGVDRLGEGVRWSADGQTAWRLRDGEEVEQISAEEAARRAEHGLPLPRLASTRASATRRSEARPRHLPLCNGMGTGRVRESSTKRERAKARGRSGTYFLMPTARAW